jgi:hypothetical protein
MLAEFPENDDSIDCAESKFHFSPGDPKRRHGSDCQEGSNLGFIRRLATW